MAESIEGPVGRRYRQHNVKNNADDQAKIIDLLSKISTTDGGKKEEWLTPPLAGPTGSCPSFVEEAIWDFQEHWKRLGHFQNIDGVVDPNKNTIAQLNLLAAGVTPPPPLPGPPAPFIVQLRQNPLITLDGTQAVARTPPIHPVEWVRRTRETFDTICANSLGLKIVQGRRKRIFVEPYLQTDRQAHAYWGATHEFDGVKFTADNFDGLGGDPGSRADEILLHELIHIAENHYGLYDDPPGTTIKYGRSDFLTITGTNVYSSSLGRGIRGEHDINFRPMPAPFAADPGEHERVFHGNYQRAHGNSPGLFNLFKNHPAPWNPFKSFTP